MAAKRNNYLHSASLGNNGFAAVFPRKLISILDGDRHYATREVSHEHNERGNN
jgi:hypothetical protein